MNPGKNTHKELLRNTRMPLNSSETSSAEDYVNFDNAAPSTETINFHELIDYIVDEINEADEQ